MGEHREYTVAHAHTCTQSQPSVIVCTYACTHAHAQTNTHFCSGLVLHDAAIIDCLSCACPAAQDNVPTSSCFVQLKAHHFLKRKVAVDVRVEDKESRGVPPQDLVPEVVQPTSRPERAVLLQVPVKEGVGKGEGQGRGITGQS